MEFELMTRVVVNWLADKKFDGEDWHPHHQW